MSDFHDEQTARVVVCLLLGERDYKADKQLIFTTVHYKTHSIYHAHYATAFPEVLEVVAGSSRRVHRCARAQLIVSGENWLWDIKAGSPWISLSRIPVVFGGRSFISVLARVSHLSAAATMACSGHDMRDRMTSLRHRIKSHT